MGVHRAARPGRTRWSAATALVLLALFAGAVGAAPALAATGTYVRLGQFTPGMPGNELVVFPVGEAGDEVRIPAVDYGGLSEYRRIEPGDYVVGIRPAGTDGPPVVTSTLDAMPGSAYTLAAVGPADAPVLTVVPDDLTRRRRARPGCGCSRRSRPTRSTSRAPAGSTSAGRSRSGRRVSTGRCPRGRWTSRCAAPCSR